MVARMMVADVFVHGIGGAAYDQITDDIVHRLTGCDPPRHAVVSGTLRLPITHEQSADAQSDPAAELAQVHRMLRDLEFHPERHLVPLESQPEAVRELVAQKQRWIDTHPTATLARRRCQEIRATNERMQVHASDLRQALLARVGPLATRMRARKLLRSRGHPWCFFPEKTLKSFLVLEND
jgi:hypothetical protein